MPQCNRDFRAGFQLLGVGILELLLLFLPVASYACICRGQIFANLLARRTWHFVRASNELFIIVVAISLVTSICQSFRLIDVVLREEKWTQTFVARRVLDVIFHGA